MCAAAVLPGWAPGWRPPTQPLDTCSSSPRIPTGPPETHITYSSSVSRCSIFSSQSQSLSIAA